MISRARSTAFHVLTRVEAGGWASDLLLVHAADLDSRDAGLASEIVYGSLRHRVQLDYLIRHYSGRDPASLDAPVLVALRIGIYQLRYMDRIPPHAAVGESVELAKREATRAASGLVNAVLRKVGREPVEWPDRATALSMPEWLLDRWDRQFGPEQAERIARAFLRPAATYVRNPPVDALLELEPADVPGAFRVVSGDARGHRIQDVSSQAVVPLLGLELGQTFLDLCAAPGNKTAQALESGVKAVACDLHLFRLRNVPNGCARVALDATIAPPFRTTFDRILVDAPCSGTGTLSRNPEIRWQLTPADIRDLHGRQTQILRNALDLLAPEGRLVYSTCSLETRENEDVVARVLKKAEGRFRLESEMRRFPGTDPGDGFYAAVITSTR
ncbi:MAG TPA: transcription antitermination factor NusB [Bryobacteraceae bacterium]|nr:transcription antitermination factor NusB [Bryobacteraceae bacterium]